MISTSAAQSDRPKEGLEPLRSPQRPAHRRLFSWKQLGRLALVGVAFLLTYELGRRLVGWNLHTVVAGRVYRGAQPNASYVETLAKNYGVRTIINLRGCGLPNEWYAMETRAVQHLGIDQEDICFSALRLPSSLELRRLVEVLEQAAYPVFFHCRRGADRTGMASVIALLLQPDVTLSDARKQLGLWYGHVALSKTGILDQFIDLYEDWLGKQGRRHDAAAFRHWILDEYNGGWCSARFEEFVPLGQDVALSGAPVGAVFKRGEPIGYRVKVRNTGCKTWQMHAGLLSGIHLGYQIWDGESLLAEGRGGMWDKEVPPGQEVTITLVISPLHKTGACACWRT